MKGKTKQITKKLIAILVTVLMLMNSSVLTIISMAKDNEEKAIDTSKVKAISEIAIEKYVNYELESTKGVLVKLGLKTGIKYENGQEYKALKTTKTGIITPQINEEYPEKVEVLATSTKATNGDENAKDFKYGYNKENGQITIEATNEKDKDGKIYSENVADARDSYKINLYYSSNCYAKEETKRKIELKGMIEEEISDKDNTKITSAIEKEYELEKNLSGIVSADVTTTDIYNGYIYANDKNGTKLETKYAEKIDLNIDYNNISDELLIVEEDNFIKTVKNKETNKNEEKEYKTEDIIYTATKVNKNNVLNILGEEGKLQILNKDQKLLLEVNKNTEAEDDGTIEIKYDGDVTKLIYRTTKPEKIGKIEITNAKKISNEIKDINIKKINTKTTVTAINNREEKDEETDEVRQIQEKIYNFEKENIIQIKNSQTKMNINLDNTKWTNNTQNDVKFTATLVANSPKYNLFKDPTLEIKLPSDVEKVILGEVSLLHDNKLIIKDVKVINKNGNKIIKIELLGTQKKYTLDSILEGADLVIPAKLILKDNITSSNKNIQVTYKNETGLINDYEAEGETTKRITIQEQDKKEINSTKGNLYTISQKDANTKPTNTATVKSSSVANPKITETNQSASALKFEVTPQIGNKILKNGDTIYENQVITYKVRIANTSGTNLTNLKFIGRIPTGLTYVTVEKHDGIDSESLEDTYEYVKHTNKTEYTSTINKLEAGKTVEAIYEVQVNELDQGTTELPVISQFELYNSSNTKISEASLNNTIKEEPIYAKMVGSATTSLAVENQFQGYLIVKNTKSVKLNNVNISVNIPEYMEVYQTGILGNTNTLSNENKSANGYYTATIPEMQPNEEVEIKIYMKATKLVQNVYTYQLEIAGKVTAEGLDEYNTNLVRSTMETRQITVDMDCDFEGEEVEKGTEIEYFVTIKSNGTNAQSSSVTVNVLDYLPEGLSPKEITYTNYKYNDESEDYELETNSQNISVKSASSEEELETAPDVNVYVTIPNGEEVTMTIKAVTNIVYEQTELQNSISVINGDNTIISNTVKFTLLPYNYGEEDDNLVVVNPGKGGSTNNNATDDTTESNSISGQVWLDKNKNGKKEESEERISNITVKLFEATNGNIVTNSNGEKFVIQTDSNGYYKFSNVPNGEYMVVFEYDTAIYTITEYQKSKVTTNINSDAISQKLKIDGETKTVGLTDIISINDGNAKNIDMGLLKGGKADISIKKYVSKITVNGPSGAKEYSYNNTDLAKVEVPSKETENSTINIEYKLVVTNEGDVPTYISEITDNMPNGLKLDSINGKYEQEKNSIKITALSGVLLKPGKSKAVKLVASTKQLGNFTNTAEITNITNESNLADSEESNNKSEATVIISVKTGAIIGISIAVIAVIVLAIAFVTVGKNHRLLKNIMKINMLFVVVATTIFIGSKEINSVEIPVVETDLTVEQLKEQLKREHTHDEIVEANLGSNFYRHATSDATILNTDKFRCSEGGLGQCGHGSHFYKANNGSLEINHEITGIGGETLEYPYVDASGSVDMEKLDKSYNIVGPYKITKNTKAKNEKTNFKVYDGNGSVIRNFEICDKGGASKNFEFNETFYVKVPSGNLEVSKITTNITGKQIKGDTKQFVTFKIHEYWSIDHISGNHTGGCRKGVGNTQDGERIYEKKYVINDENKNLVTIELPGASLAGEKTVKVVEEAGVLSFEKVDDRDLSNYYSGKKSNSYTPLENVGFKISIPAKKYVKTGTKSHGKKRNPHNDNVYGFREGYTLWVQSDRSLKETESVVYTDSYGRIYINLNDVPKTGGVKCPKNGTTDYKPMYIESSYKWNIEEVKNPYYGFKDSEGSTWSVNKHGIDKLKGKNALKNHQKYIKLSGFVWFDEQSGKLSQTDGKFSGEAGVNGIKVNLMEGKSVVKSTKTSELGIYDIEGGEYRFKDVDLDKLEAGNYHVEFEYCGVQYQSVEPDIDSAKGSKAIDTKARKALDSNFTEVAGNGSQTVSSGGVNMSYNSVNSHISTLDDHMKKEGGLYAYTEDTGHTCTGGKVIASTEEAGYELQDDFKPVMEEIKNVNLGLFKKAQTDYSLSQDLYDVKVQINNKMHIYRYCNKRFTISGNIKESYVNPENEDAVKTALGVKYQKDTGTYNRPIYTTDVLYDVNPSNTIKMRLTYKVALRNQATYNGHINSIINYCDTRFNIKAIGTSIDDKDNVTNTVGSANSFSGNSGSGYKGYKISLNEDINSKSTKYLYIQYEITTDGIRSAFSRLQAGTESALLNNVYEIDSYTTYKDGGGTLAVYDRNSVPSNDIPGNVSNYENDTDGARSLKLVLENARTISGIAFVDATESEEYRTNKTRIGNGVYRDGGDKPLTGVKVTLQEIGKPDQESMRYITQTVSQNGKYGLIEEPIINSSGKEIGKKLTPELYNSGNSSRYLHVADLNTGEFFIGSYIPGNYIAKYTWGDKEYKVQYYKSTIFDGTRITNGNGSWYNGEYSDGTIIGDNNAIINGRDIGDRYWWKNDNITVKKQDAVDSPIQRARIDAQIRANTINTLEDEISDAYDNKNNKHSTKIDSYSPTMSFDVEYISELTNGNYDEDPFVINNIDFGIVERARQGVNIDKRITHFKVLLANGQILIDADVDKNGRLSGSKNYTAYMGPIFKPYPNSNVKNYAGALKAEMDSELIEGATVEITYTITVKNISELDFSNATYYYYGIHGTNEDIIKFSVDNILDYVDSTIKVDEKHTLTRKIGTTYWKEHKEDGTPPEDENSILEKYNSKQKDKKASNGDDYKKTIDLFRTEDLNTYKLIPTETKEVSMTTTKLLSSTDENSYNNKTEIVEMSKEKKPITGSPISYVSTKIIDSNTESDGEEVIIIPSTGEDKNYTVYIILGAVIIIALGVGVFIIKKVVVDKK